MIENRRSHCARSTPSESEAARAENDILKAEGQKTHARESLKLIAAPHFVRKIHAAGASLLAEHFHALTVKFPVCFLRAST
jgi:hypothetical protein